MKNQQENVLAEFAAPLLAAFYNKCTQPANNEPYVDTAEELALQEEQNKMEIGVAFEDNVYLPAVFRPEFAFNIVEYIGEENDSNWEIACNRAEQLNQERADRLAMVNKPMYKELFNELLKYEPVITKIVVERTMPAICEELDDEVITSVFTADKEWKYEKTASWSVTKS